MGFGAAAEPVHAIAMHGEPAYPPGFSHFSYVNPDAPKGGRLALGALGSFDSLNPLIVKGNSAVGIRDYVYESLMARGFDEPFSLYGLLAESVETPPDRSWVQFTLRPQARFSDGAPVTALDVLFSHALLRDHGRPNHRYYYSKVARAEQVGPRTVRFTFAAGGDREMPLIMGLMPVLPRHRVAPDRFEETGFAAPVGSGPYLVGAVDAGRRIVYRRNMDYWARDLSVTRGQFNFDAITIDYFRDANALFEAFRRGLVQVFPEDDPTRWNSGFGFPAAIDGRVARDEFSTATPAGMSGFVFNLRRPLFADIRVRRALGLLFDFEWINRTLFFDAYARTGSYFAGSELASAGRSASERERALLVPFADRLAKPFLDGTYRPPVSDGGGRNRANRHGAIALLEEAGFRLKGGQMVAAATGEPFSFEILVATREEERLALTYARALAGAGIEARVRQVDSTQYQQRRQTFDYDMIINRWYASLSPGNEQTVFWGSQAAGEPGSRNYAGIQNPAVDAMIERLLAAPSREDFVAAARALDRVLLAGYYVIPLFHLPHQWVARWTMIAHPQTTSAHGYLVDTWWRADLGGNATGGGAK